MPTYKEVFTFAQKAHEGVYRRFTGEPYFAHPVRVAETLKKFGVGSDMAMKKALLHDVVEDTNYTCLDIMEKFGQELALSCYYLCDPNVPHPNPSLTKIEKVHRYGENIEHGSEDDANIKLADILDNVPSMVQYAKHEKAVSYVTEKRCMMGYLTKGGSELYDHVYDMLMEQDRILQNG